MEQETLAGSPDTLGAVLQRAVAKPCEDVKSCPEAWSRKACLQTAGAGGGRKQRSWEPLLTPDPWPEAGGVAAGGVAAPPWSLAEWGWLAGKGDGAPGCGPAERGPQDTPLRPVYSTSRKGPAGPAGGAGSAGDRVGVMWRGVLSIWGTTEALGASSAKRSTPSFVLGGGCEGLAAVPLAPVWSECQAAGRAPGPSLAFCTVHCERQGSRWHPVCRNPPTRSSPGAGRGEGEGAGTGLTKGGPLHGPHPRRR